MPVYPPYTPPAVTQTLYQSDNPSKHGLIEWNYDPISTSSGTGTSGSSGTLYLHKINAQTGGTVSNIHVVVGTAGSSLTSGQNFAAIYNSSGTRLAVTTDQTTAWGSTGHKVMTLSGSTSLTVGSDYYVGLLAVGSTPPAFVRGPTGQAAPNANLTGAALRFSVNGTGLTSTPSSVTLSSNSGTNAQPYWVALS